MVMGPDKSISHIHFLTVSGLIGTFHHSFMSLTIPVWAYRALKISGLGHPPPPNPTHRPPRTKKSNSHIHFRLPRDSDCTFGHELFEPDNSYLSLPADSLRHRGFRAKNDVRDAKNRSHTFIFDFFARVPFTKPICLNIWDNFLFSLPRVKNFGLRSPTTP